VPRWKQDATKFTVSVNYVEGRGASTSIPKPIFEWLGKPESITFILRGKRVEVATENPGQEPGEGHKKAAKRRGR